MFSTDLRAAVNRFVDDAVASGGRLRSFLQIQADEFRLVDRRGRLAARDAIHGPAASEEEAQENRGGGSDDHNLGNAEQQLARLVDFGFGRLRNRDQLFLKVD